MKNAREKIKNKALHIINKDNLSKNLDQIKTSSHYLGHKIFKKNKFRVVDKGDNNSVVVATPNAKPNIVKGNSVITFRKGNNNRVSIGENGKFNNLKIDINGNHNAVTIGDKVKFSGQLLIVGSHLSIHIGDKTTAVDCYVLARDKSVYIGSECMLSRGIEIRASDVHKIFDITTNERINCASKDVHIGDHVWITANVTVSKNVSIANGCVIAAGSFVNKPFDIPNVLIAGSPAKAIKENIRWER